MTDTRAIIYVVDDDDDFRIAVTRLLEAGGYKFALYKSGEQLLENLPGKEAGCVLLDMRMPELDGLELQKRLKEIASILPIVFLTGHGSVQNSEQAIKAGAEDVLTKPVSKTTLFDAIDRALARYHQLRDQRDRFNALRGLISTLTPREREVFMLVVRGKLNKQIAFELGTCERTVKAHRRAVMDKLGVHSIAEAVSIAERLGMLGGPGLGGHFSSPH
jgi:FixJ family two-component response regulator